MNDTHITSLALEFPGDSNRFFRGCVVGGLGWVGLLGKQISEEVFEFGSFLVQAHLEGWQL